jgi:CBF1 interacting corepressor
MGKGLKFLMVKVRFLFLFLFFSTAYSWCFLSNVRAQPWHPLTKRNQEKKFLAESKESDRLKYETERADDLRREADFMSNKKMAGDNTVDAVKLRMQAPVSFMYQEPPGLLAMRQREAKEAAERELNGPRPALSDNPSEREKLVAKFPFLANAPQEGKYTEQMAIHLKPFGMETRMVRCLRCGLWGHGAGEKICPQANDLPPTDRVTKTLLDPMRVSAMADSLANPTEEVYSYDGKGAKLAFRQAPMPMGASAQIGKSRKGSHDGQHSAEALLQQLDELQEVDEQDLANPSAGN